MDGDLFEGNSSGSDESDSDSAAVKSASEKGQSDDQEEAGSESSGGSDAESPVKNEDNDSASDSSNESDAGENVASEKDAEESDPDGGQTPMQSDSDDEEPVEKTAAADNSASENEDEVTQNSASESDNDQAPAQNDAASSSDESASSAKQSESQVEQPNKQSDLFGDADDISSSDGEESEQVAPKEETRRIEYDDEDEEMTETMQQSQQPIEDETPETRIEVEIPKINTNLGRAIHFVRFPNFVSVETRPFDPAVYEDEIEDDELLDEEGRTRMKLKVENTIRWKKYVDENGISITESNARLVRWSDGSQSMHLGSEIFDVYTMPLHGDHNHLFIRQGTGLQGQAVFKTKLTFRPHSTKSATHRKMTSRLAMRLNQNQQKVRVLPIPGQDPESRKAKLMKEEEDQLRAHMRREAQKRRMREKAHSRGVNANYLDDRLDDEDDAGAISVSAIKNKFKPGIGSGMKMYLSDSESGDEKQLANAKRLESDDSDDEDASRPKGGADESEKKKKKYFSDSDDDESAPDASFGQEQATESDD